jgi:hypothetical protein
MPDEMDLGELDAVAGIDLETGAGRCSRFSGPTARARHGSQCVSQIALVSSTVPKLDTDPEAGAAAGSGF